MTVDPGALSAGIGLAVGVAVAAVTLWFRRAGRAAREREMLEAAARAQALVAARTERRARARSSATPDARRGRDAATPPAP